VKIAYIASALHYDGYKLEGVELARHFRSEHSVAVCGAIVPDDSPLLQGHLSDEVLSAEALKSVDVVYMEGGWNLDPSTSPDRIPRDLAEAFVRRGGQLIVADVDRSAVHDQRQALWDARNFLCATVCFGTVGGHQGVRYLHDEGAGEYSEFRFLAKEMFVSDWLKPALNGIDSLLTQGPVHLVASDAVAASAHATTNVLVLDTLVDHGLRATWATAKRYGRGHVAVIGAGVSYDYLLESCPDNARWLSNLMILLSDRTREAAGWSIQSTEFRETAELSLAALLEQPESQTLERKSSFLVPTDLARSDTPQHVMQHNVGKSIAALANTDGGHVIIGQADDLTVVGLAADFTQIRKGQAHDGFELRLTEYISRCLQPGWAALGLRLHWHKYDGADAAIIEVPKAQTTVHLTDKKNDDDEVVYVRSGTRSDRLKGRELVAWLDARRPG